MNQFLVGESGVIGGIETVIRIAQIDGWDSKRVADKIIASLWWGQYHQKNKTGDILHPLVEDTNPLNDLHNQITSGHFVSSHQDQIRVQEAIMAYCTGKDVFWPTNEPQNEYQQQQSS